MLPSLVENHLNNLDVKDKAFAFLLIDGEGVLKNKGGDCEKFGFDGCLEGKNVDGSVPFLEGYLPLVEGSMVLPFVCLSNNLFIDVHLFSGEEGACVIIVDSTEEAKKLQSAQQSRNEASLNWKEPDWLDNEIQKKKSLGDDHLFSELFAGLDLLLLEKLDHGSFKTCCELPTWFHTFVSGAFPGILIYPAEIFSFLENFLIDAEEIWKSSGNRRIKSGLWMDADRFGSVYPLEATALSLGRRKILIIEHCVYAYKEKQSTIQKGRECKLDYYQINRLEKALREANAGLEKQIDERTSELRQSNQALLDEIFEKKRAEEALRTSECRYRQLFEESPIALLEGDFSQVKQKIDFLHANGIDDLHSYFEQHLEEASSLSAMLKVLDANKATNELFGAEDKVEITDNLINLLASQSPKLFIDQFVFMYSGAFARKPYEMKNLRGDRIIISIKSTSAPGCGENWAKVYISIIDLTEQIIAEKERERLAAQVMQMQKMEAIGTLAGGIAHDFNNVLSVIVGFTELAGLQVDKNSPVRENLHKVLDASERAKELIKQILSFTKQRGGEPKPSNLGSIVIESLEMLRASLPSTIEIRRRIESDLPPIEADESQIQQIIMNLCVNAFHAMGKNGGVLEVALEAMELDDAYFSTYSAMVPGSYLKLSVSDTGHGITPEILPRIFEPYFSCKEIGDGTGLGLSIVHGIVKNYKGHIDVTSVPGEGAVFNVYFPIDKNIELLEGDDVVLGEIPRGKGRILFVDDEATLVRLGRERLEYLGYEVKTSTSSREALAAFRENPKQFDLVISDMTMPKMSGDEFAMKIRKIDPSIPIILCTGFSERLDSSKAKDLGINCVMMKPFALRDLAETVGRFIKKH